MSVHIPSSSWKEHHPFGLYDEGFTHHVSYTIGLTKVLEAPIVYLAFVNRTLMSGYTDAGDGPMDGP